MKMNMYKWIEETIANKEKKALPVLSFPSVQKMDVTVDELTRDSDKQSQGMKIIADNFDTAAAVSYMDLSVEAEAFGSEIRFSAEEVPTVVGSIVDTEEEAEALEVPKVGAGRTGNCVEAMRKAAELITDRPVLAGCIGPFSLAGRLMDVSNAMINCYEEPDMVHIVMKKVTAFLIDYIKAFKETGINGVVVAEPLAGLLSLDLAQEFSGDYVKQIVEAVQDENFVIVYHNCGNSTIATVDSIVNNGCRVFHFGNAIKLSEMMPHIPEGFIAMGNVDPAGEFRNGTPESIYKTTTELLTECSKYPNFVISSGCDIPPMTPWENIDSFFKAVKDFYKA
ncbi:MAG: uroporphyrinogen decarboxylase family protein [Lachnospiraceae bacterium]|nr:uroporphyrinogen decarboxylase family protein [Lachnospiraceae bacterium]